MLPLLQLIEVSDDVLPALGELEAEHVEYKALEELRCRWRDLRSEEIHSKLETMEYELKGPDDVSLIIGGWRLENVRSSYQNISFYIITSSR